MKKIAIFGAGGFGREVKMLIDQINQKEETYEVIGFYDDKFFDGKINSLPYLGGLDDLNAVDYNLEIALGVGNPTQKKSIVSKIKNENISYPNLIHPNVLIGADDVSIGVGNVICAGVIITVNVKIIDFVTINLACTVGHDTKIGSYSSFMPTVNISGEVQINDSVYVGTGAKIINQLEIGENTVVGAGAVVSKSLPPNCTAVGIPAKPIKFH